MADTMMGSLREVQELDDRIREADKALVSFDDQLAEVEEPALALEAQRSQLQERLSQMEADERRLERAADDKRARAQRLELRLNRVTRLREEVAVQAELDLIRRAIEGDEHEALQLLDQIRRSESILEELEASALAARAEVGPQQESLRAEREGFRELRAALQARRAEILEQVGEPERRVYDAFFRSGRRVIVASLLEDGACGNCFGVVPLQLQNDIRESGGIIRCENCGVILTAEPEPALDAGPQEEEASSDAEAGDGNGSFQILAGVDEEAEAE